MKNKTRCMLGVAFFFAGLSCSSLANANVISNDTWWVDNNGNNVLASMGGHITLVGDTYYWVGNDPQASLNGEDIHLYSSKTLGSSSWKHEGKMVDFAPGTGASNCSLLYSHATGKYVIVAKSGLQFYESASITGPYTLQNTILKNQLGNRTNYKIGGLGTFQDGTNAYVITSRRWLGLEDNHRYTGIYKLTPDFLDVAEEVCWLRNDSREAMWLFKKDDTYYMTASHTAGWTASACYYRTSTNLVDWSAEQEIGMDPIRPGGTQALKIMRSHGSQHRFIIQLANGQWIYGGDRYPYHEPESHPFEKGLYIFCPVVWSGGHPTVKWESVWSPLDAYDVWTAGYGLTGSNALNSADLEPDGLNNLLEYALGGNPTTNDAALLPKGGIISDLGTNWLEYVFRRRSDYEARGLTYTVEANTNLVTDTWMTNGVLDIGSGSIDADFDSVTNRISTDENPQQFIRLKLQAE